MRSKHLQKLAKILPIPVLNISHICLPRITRCRLGSPFKNVNFFGMSEFSNVELCVCVCIIKTLPVFNILFGKNSIILARFLKP